MRTAYQPLISLAFRVSWHKLKRKYSEGYDERRGIQSPEKMALLGGRRPLWVHGVSVGEVQAAVPLVRAARSAGYDGPVILSTTTETGKAMALKLGADLFDAHIYYPWDKREFVRAALDAVRPWAFATAETELWPNMLWELKDRNIPSFLVNGRISDRTWKRLNSGISRAAGCELYGLFTKLFVRDERDAERLKATGVIPDKISVCGDSKIDALLARKDAAAVESWKEKFGFPERPVFMAGSTHPGEDEIVFEAFNLLREREPDARLLFAPRHPERASSIIEMTSGKYRVCRLSEMAGGWDVLVVDKIGVLFELYGTSVSAFVGGSFVDKGGQNILEPVSWGVPVQYGPHMEDFAEASREFISLGVATQVNNAPELAETWINVAKEGRNGVKYKEASEKYFAGTSGAAKKTWDAISKFGRETI